MDTDVVIAGAGCAAFAAAIILANAGVKTIVVASPNRDEIVGDLPETLSHGAVHILGELGLPLSQLESELTPLAGRLSKWGYGPARYAPGIGRVCLLLGK